MHGWVQHMGMHAMLCSAVLCSQSFLLPCLPHLSLFFAINTCCPKHPRMWQSRHPRCQQARQAGRECHSQFQKGSPERL